MERVVYLLGAGFSAPLGIPVVGNFLQRSKDLYFENPVKWAHFKSVFDTIRELAVCKNYYSIDLFNIEDILSLLEMRSRLADEQEATTLLVRYIADVIKASTPAISGSTEGQNWAKTVFGSEPWNYYGPFIASFLDHGFRKVTERKGPNSIEYDAAEFGRGATAYAVITLNYDTVFESVAADLNRRFGTKKFRREFVEKPTEGPFHGYLAKHHGSVDTGDIVPPTPLCQYK